MKKIALFLCLVLALSLLLTSCTPSSADPVDVTVAAIKGPSSIGLIQFMDKADKGEVDTNNFAFSIAASADELVPKIVQGEIDIAALPPNLASVLFNQTDGQVQVLAIGTLGMLYVLESGESIQSVEDLRGKTIYAGFKGKSPEYDLSYVLSANGIDPEKDITIEWKSEHSECVAALAADENAIAVLPQPFVTVAQNSNDKLRIALDINAEWNKLQSDTDNPSALITGVVAARKEFVEQNPDAVADFLERYKTSADFAVANVEQAAVLVGNYDIVPQAVAEKAIPHCNITYIEGEEMKDRLSGYLNVLFEQNPQSVGGALPDESFYVRP